MNVIDAFQPSKALAMSDVANALGQVNSVQCGPAGGATALPASKRSAADGRG